MTPKLKMPDIAMKKLLIDTILEVEAYLKTYTPELPI
jgi:hypothetical protein